MRHAQRESSSRARRILVPGSARLSRVGFGVTPKQAFLNTEIAETISEN
jgi:hypothetical protein